MYELGSTPDRPSRMLFSTLLTRVHSRAVPRAAMYAVYVRTLGRTPARCIQAMVRSALSHWPTRPRAVMRAVQETTSGRTSAASMSSKCLTACSHWPPTAQALMAAE